MIHPLHGRIQNGWSSFLEGQYLLRKVMSTVPARFISRPKMTLEMATLNDVLALKWVSGHRTSDTPKKHRLPNS